MKQSAGILLYRNIKATIEVFLVHPGGPFWKKKDLGAWTIPKGELEESEEPLQAALREFREETGHSVSGNFIPVGSVKQKSGKTVTAWAVEGDIDPATIMSSTFLLEWPPRSGNWSQVPEIDKAQWFTIEEALLKINPAQCVFLERLMLSSFLP